VFIEQVKNAVAAMLVIAVLNCMNYSGRIIGGCQLICEIFCAYFHSCYF
jgi:hypothetical protein